MIGGRKILAVGALLAGLLLPAQAMAAYEAWTRADLNLRVGPDTSYGVIDVIPYGEPVAVIGCLDGIEWCDVEWYGLRGWVSAYYLAQPGTSLYLPQVYTRIGLPIIVFSFDSYHDRHYHDRPWYKKRYGRWHGKDWRKHRDRDDDDHDYSDRDDDRDGADRPRKGERVQRPGKDLKVERPRQRQEVEKPRKRQEAKKPSQRQEVQNPRKVQEVQKSRKRQETKRPERQRVEQKQVRSSKQSQSSGQSSQSSRQVERSQRKVEVERRRGQ